MSDENTKLTIKDKLDSFIKAYPKAQNLSCTFLGSGDSFDSFDNICVLNDKGKSIDFGSEFDFESIFESIIEHDDRADFNNDGSCGVIEINLKTRRVKIDVSHYEMREVPQGEETYLIGEDGEVGEDADLV
jgi:hypothetical protein